MSQTEFKNNSMELAVLASLMTISDSYERLPEQFGAQDFVTQGHQVIFNAITALAKAGSPYDAIFVLQYLESHGLAVNGLNEAYLMQLLAESPATLFNLEAFCNVLIALTERRQAALLLEQGNAVLKANPDQPADEVIAQVITQLNGLSTKNLEIKNTVQSAAELLDGFLNNDFAGTPTGYTELDHKIGGLAAGQVIIVAGRPAMGKSVLMANLVDELEQQNNAPAVIFSIEMKAREVAARFVANHSQVHYGRFKSAEWQDGEFDRVQGYLEQWKQRKILIDDRKELTIDQIRIACKKLKRQYGKLSCIAVDYLQLITATNKKDIREQQIAEMSRGLKVLAGDMDCPVIVLSQLNRTLENRPNKRPIMSDLRESGTIEQDADLILFIYRDEVYNKDTKFSGIAEIIIGKQRSGPLGTVPLIFNGALARFENPRYAIELDGQEQAA